MDMLIVDLGTHSIRKGVSTFLSGIPGGPTAISIYLRAGWSLGNVQNRYILDGGGGDQLCGRATTGLDINDVSFASLPPHFDQATLNLFTTEEWEMLLPEYSTWYPPKFRQVIPFLVASLGYHKQWLIDNLHPNHRLFNSRLWTNEKFQLELIPRILSGTFYNRTGGLRATGVPCHLIIARKVEELGDQIQKQNEKFSTLLDDIPESDKNKILDHFTVNGQSLSRSDVQAMLTNMRQELCDLIRNNPQQQQQAQAPLMENDDGSVVSPDGYKLFYWRGKYRYVPEFFQFPRCHLQMLWDQTSATRLCLPSRCRTVMLCCCISSFQHITLFDDKALSFI